MKRDSSEDEVERGPFTEKAFVVTCKVVVMLRAQKLDVCVFRAFAGEEGPSQIDQRCRRRRGGSGGR